MPHRKIWDPTFFDLFLTLRVLPALGAFGAFAKYGGQIYHAEPAGSLVIAFRRVFGADFLLGLSIGAIFRPPGCLLVPDKISQQWNVNLNSFNIHNQRMLECLFKLQPGCCSDDINSPWSHADLENRAVRLKIL
jgi:hypothetical protein